MRISFQPRPKAAAFDASKLDPVSLRRERDRVVSRAEDHNPPITRIVPVPRAIRLGGSLRVVAELRLRDLAEIQAWLEEQVPHPLEGMPPAWADPDPETRPARLAAAWERAGSWPVRHGTARADGLLSGGAGRAFFLALMVRRFDADFGAADALELLGRVTPAEWSALLRVAYARSPREEIAAEVAPDRDQGGRTANWCLSAYRASQAEGGPSPLELGDWTISQWRNFCREGKAAELEPEFSATAARARKALGVADGR